MGLKIGVVGAGGFVKAFIPLFQAHPLVEKVALAELIDERRKETAEKFNITETYPSFEDMLEKADIDCVAIFTPRQTHGPFVIKAMQQGKHVYSAVPIANTVEEIQQIVELAKETRLIYMMGETCHYFPCAMFCRKAYREGKFGKFVYAESQYYHDMRHFYEPFKRSGGKDWKRIAGLPPFYYPTHSVGMVLSALNTYATKVTAFGITDNHEDEIFRVGNNNWDNPFSNETMLLKLANGGAARINEFRRIGTKRPSSYITGFYGTDGAYECTSKHHTLQQLIGDDDGRVIDVGPEVNTIAWNEEKDLPDPDHNRALDFKYDKDFSPIHNVARLPEEFDEQPNGHNGSHQFLIDDFLKAVDSGKLPPSHAWSAARYMLPGIIGHESAKRDGEPLDIPDFGDPPADWELLKPDGDLLS